jgi:hypothetical protein
MGIRMLLAMMIAGTITACAPGSTGSPDASVSATPITSPVTGRATATQAETATVMPTETLQPTPTPENPYQIDLAKVRTVPESTGAFLANPEKYQRMPDPLGTGPGEGEAAFEACFNEVANGLGNIQKLPASLFLEIHTLRGSNPLSIATNGDRSGSPVVGPLYFLYFTHEGVNYPIVGVNVGLTEGKGNASVDFIILEQTGYIPLGDGAGIDQLARLHDGNDVYRVSFLLKPFDPKLLPRPPLDPNLEKILSMPFNWVFSDYGGLDQIKYNVGVGSFWTTK